MSTVISGIENIANKAEHNLITSQSSESFEKEMANAKTMFNSRVDGLLVSLAYDTEGLNHFDFFLSEGSPLFSLTV